MNPTERLPRSRAWISPLILLAVVTVVHSVSPTPQSGDSRLSMVVAWRFITHFDIHLETIPAVQALASRADLIEYGGHLLPFFPWPAMLLALPGTLLVRLIGVDPLTLSISDPSLTWIVEVPTASLLVGLTAVLLRRIILDLGETWATPRVAMFSAVVFAFGTIAWSIGSRALWQQTASMFFVTAAILALQRSRDARRWPVLLGVFLGLALVCRPTNAIFAIVLGVWMLWKHRRQVPLVIAGLLAVGLPFALFSLGQYGSALPPYYAPSRVGDTPVYPFWESAAVLLVSPSRGLLIYVPLLVLSVAGVVISVRRGRFASLDLVFIVSFIGQFLLIAKFGSTNGATYGPRLMLDTVPLLILLAVPAIALLRPPSRAAGLSTLAAATSVAVLLGWGLFVNATGALFRSALCWNATPVLLDDEPERVWDWDDPQFLRPYRDIARGDSLAEVVVPSCTSHQETPQ